MVNKIRYYIWCHWYRYKRKQEPYIEYLRTAYGIHGIGKTLTKKEREK